MTQKPLIPLTVAIQLCVKIIEEEKSSQSLVDLSNQSLILDKSDIFRSYFNDYSIIANLDDS